ncbi:MAG: glpK [Firmicutes bacterium]|nr:glpK [Bacillota bacterium]
MNPYILALDQGTTSSRALLFSAEGLVIAASQQILNQHYPKPGYVEHDPIEIWESQLHAMKACLDRSGIPARQIVALGITNQRETVVVWEKDTGRPIHPAVVWQCRRTAALCDQLRAQGLEETVREKTGLLIDAYFSGTKLCWILDHVAGARARAEAGELLCGTIDSWLIWNLTGGAAHVSDYSNCSRTMLFDIHKLCWDEELCRVMGVPMNMLPEPVSNSQEYGRLKAGIPGLEALGGLPIRGAAGDQQAALFGQACFEAGQIKNTYGTGCFALMNTGNQAVRSEHGLLSSIGWALGEDLTYVLEGSVFNAGSAIQWLRDELGVIRTAGECDLLAESVLDNGGVYMVSAFTGLGAPHWDMYARGTLLGLTRGSSRAQLCRAVLEGITYQTADLMLAMSQDAGRPIPTLRVDGGASVSDFMMQFQADLLQIPVERPTLVETTAWGAACLAGLSAGVWGNLKDLKGLRSTERVFLPQKDRNREYATWKRAVQRTLQWAQEES